MIRNDISCVWKHNSIHNVRQLTRQKEIIGKYTKRTEDAIHHKVREDHDNEESKETTSIQSQTNHEIREDLKQEH